MNPKKSKEKERRRARKLAEEAWEAANDQNLDLAEKIIRRAVETQPENPVLWNDQGMLLRLRDKEPEAEEAFRAAISLAPTYAEAFAHLADIQAKHGYFREAVQLMETAARHAPPASLYSERLETYRALLGSQERSAKDRREVPVPGIPEAATPGRSHWSAKVLGQDWSELGEQLTREGCVHIPGLVDLGTCVELCSMFDEDDRFAKTVVMERDDFGRGVYRYFKAPIPVIVDGLRRAAYPQAARIANEWQRLLGEVERFPEDWEGFRRQCADAGQTTPTPILLKYGPGGFNSLHRDLRGTVYFPIQMAIVLSPLAGAVGAGAVGTGTDGFSGGEFLFCDVPESKKSRRQEIAAGLGDAVLFCTRDRLIRVGGAYGLQPVKHGVNPITEGSRVVLGVPFHEYR